MQRLKTTEVKLLPAAIRGRYTVDGDIMQRLEYRPNGCINTLTSVQKDNVLVELLIKEKSDMINDTTINVGNVNPSGRGMNGSVYDAAGISPTLTTNKGEGSKVMTQYRVRKLTQKECWRLMGFSDMDFEKSKERLNDKLYGGKDRSGSQLYKQAGNSIVVDVLHQIMSELYTAMPYLFEDIVVGSFFSGIGAFEKALSMLPDEPLASSLWPIGDGGVVAELTQIGYINDYNGDANRIYDSSLARALKAEAGGGGAKTGWYRVQ